MKEFIVTDMGKFCDIIENVKLNSTYRKSKIQLISNRNQRKLRASHLTQIAQRDLEIQEVQVYCMKCGFINPKPTGRSVLVYCVKIFNFQPNV